MNLDCIILAAGKANRFGCQKLLENLGEKKVLQYSLDSIPKDLFENIVIVSSNKKVFDSVLDPKIVPVLYDGGPVSDSIKTGLEKDRKLRNGFLPTGLMFINADQPFVKASTIENMINCFSNNPESVIRINYDGIPGNPVIFPQCAFEDLFSLSSDKGGCSILDSNKYNVLYVNASNKAELFDIDTKEDLYEAEKILRSV